MGALNGRSKPSVRVLIISLISDTSPLRIRITYLHKQLSTMSKAGNYLKTAISMVTSLEEGKPHSSITDWIEVLSSDRYEELSLDGISELVESVNILGSQGTTVSFLRFMLSLLERSYKHLSPVGSFASYQEEAQVR